MEYSAVCSVIRVKTKRFVIICIPERQRRVFKAKNPEQLRQWYRVHLGVPVEEWGGTAFRWQSPDNPGGIGTTVWSIFKPDTDYFGPGPSPFMINFRVDDLVALLAALRVEGCQVEDKMDDSEYGKFGWVTDPKGTRGELWQPPARQQATRAVVKPKKATRRWPFHLQRTGCDKLRSCSWRGRTRSGPNGQTASSSRTSPRRWC